MTWCPFAKHIPIAWNVPEWTQQSMEPAVVVNHIMQGYQRTIDGWASGQSRWMRYIITHFSVSRDGRIVQYWPIDRPGIHSSSVRYPTARIPKERSDWAHGANLYSVSIEHEGFSVAPSYGYDYVYTENDPWPAPMVEASIRVHEWICQQTGIDPSTDTVIGHGEIDAVTRANDPGRMWPRDRILEALRPDSPELTYHEAVEAVTDAYNPSYKPEAWRFDPLPVENGEERYMLRKRVK